MMNESCTELADLAFVDLETGGLNPFEDEILEVAVIRVRHVDVMRDDIRVIQRLSSCIMPKSPSAIHPEAKKINGFSVDKWRERHAVTLETAWGSIRDILKNTIFVGQNATFDYRFLMNAHRNLNLPPLELADYHLVDLSSIAHILRCAGRIQDVSTDTIADHYGIKRRIGPHSAYKDSQLAIENYRGLMSEIMLHG